METKSSKKRKVLFISAALFVILIVAVFISRGCGKDPQSKFASYFTKSGIVEIKYKPLGNTNVVEWVDLVKDRYKLLIATYSGKVKELRLQQGKEFTTYYPEGKEVERVTSANESFLVNAVGEAKKGNLKISGRSNGLVRYKFKEDESSSSNEALNDVEVALASDTGQLKEITYLDKEHGDKSLLQVVETKRIPYSKAKEVFTAKEAKGVKPKRKKWFSGIDAATLKRFKSYTPYWLGPTFDGYKVARINGQDTGTPKAGYMVVYGSVEEPAVEFVAQDRNEKEKGMDAGKIKYFKPADSAWKYTRPQTKIKIQGFPARLVDHLGSTDIYIRMGKKSQFRITGYNYKYKDKKARNRYIRLIEKNLQRP